MNVSLPSCKSHREGCRYDKPDTVASQSDTCELPDSNDRQIPGAIWCTSPSFREKLHFPKMPPTWWHPKADKYMSAVAGTRGSGQISPVESIRASTVFPPLLNFFQNLTEGPDRHRVGNTSRKAETAKQASSPKESSKSAIVELGPKTIPIWCLGPNSTLKLDLLGLAGDVKTYDVPPAQVVLRGLGLRLNSPAGFL